MGRDTNSPFTSKAETCSYRSKRHRQRNSVEYPPLRLYEDSLSHPELPAVRLGDEFVTYAELRALSLKVAHKLKRGVRTAIILEKSIAQVVAVIGCSLAGAPFIPLSPDHPSIKSRHRYGQCGSGRGSRQS